MYTLMGGEGLVERLFEEMYVIEYAIDLSVSTLGIDPHYIGYVSYITFWIVYFYKS